jgi:hypothetical protein
MKHKIYLFPLIVLAALSACVGTRTAYQAADSPDKMAYVITEHYTALVTEAANRKDAGTLTGDALAKVQAADRAVSPLVLQLGPLSQAYTATKSAETQAELQAAINKAVLALTNLIDALKGAR